MSGDEIAILRAELAALREQIADLRTDAAEDRGLRKATADRVERIERAIDVLLAEARKTPAPRSEVTWTDVGKAVAVLTAVLGTVFTGIGALVAAAAQAFGHGGHQP